MNNKNEGEPMSSENTFSAKIINIQWERVHIFFDIEINSSYPTLPKFYLINGQGDAKAELNTVKTDGSVITVTTNITNTGNIKCLPVGNYSVFAVFDENEHFLCDADEKISEKPEEFNCDFLYDSKRKKYTVSFTRKDNSILMSTNKLDFSAANLKGKIRKLLGFIKRSIFIFEYKLLCLFMKRENTVMFLSEQSTEISTNLQAVRDRMTARGLDKDYKIIEAYHNAASKNFKITDWFDVVKKAAQSSVIVIDDHAPIFDWVVLKKDTVLIQLWHAGAGFKSAGYSRWGNEGGPDEFNCHRQYTYGISGSKKISHFFSEVWGINTEQVIPTGLPRMDKFLSPEYREATTKKLYEKYPFLENKKVILFAPTYRGTSQNDAGYPFELIDFKKLYDICSDNGVAIFKNHPFIKSGVPIPQEYSSRIFDLSDYYDINDLFYITDLLVTDYSSNIFEFSLMKKPMLFFAFDEKEYSISRGFHRDYHKSAPGKIVHTFDELIEAVEKEDFEIEKVYEYIENQFDYFDSNASDRVIDWLILGKLPEDKKSAIQKAFDAAEATAKLKI